MILFDTSVVFDLMDTESPFHAWANEQLASAVVNEGAAINTICLAEVLMGAGHPGEAVSELRAIGFNLVDIPVSAAPPAARSSATYLKRRKADGLPKLLLPDFFIGAHAEAENMALVTRDPARIKSYFPSVELITP
jgi:predicted nucleic acid-binding protein